MQRTYLTVLILIVRSCCFSPLGCFVRLVPALFKSEAKSCLKTGKRQDYGRRRLCVSIGTTVWFVVLVPFKRTAIHPLQSFSVNSRAPSVLSVDRNHQSTHGTCSISVHQSMQALPPDSVRCYVDRNAFAARSTYDKLGVGEVALT